MKRIGILGGTFNPIHIGHLVMAQTALEEFHLDKIIFVPSHFPPHKTSRNVVLAKDRLEMVRLAVTGNPAFEVLNIEVKRGGKSYSIDTVSQLKSESPSDTTLFFIIGFDSLSSLHRWKNIDELLQLTTFIVINRPGFKPTNPRIPKRKILWAMMPGLGVSSSYLRRQLAFGKSVKYLVPEKVLEYIKKKDLYSRKKF